MNKKWFAVGPPVFEASKPKEVEDQYAVEYFRQIEEETTHAINELSSQDTPRLNPAEEVEYRVDAYILINRLAMCDAVRRLGYGLSNIREIERDIRHQKQSLENTTLDATAGVRAQIEYRINIYSLQDQIDVFEGFQLVLNDIQNLTSEVQELNT